MRARCKVFLTVFGWQLACQRAEPTSTVTSAAVTSAGVDSGPAPGMLASRTPPTTSLSIRLEGAASKDGSTEVALVVTTGGYTDPVLSAPVATVREPWGCVGAPHSAERYIVSCTPRFREVLPTVERSNMGISVSWRSQGSEQRRDLRVSRPSELTSVAESLLVVRSLQTGEGRPARRRARITLEAVHDINTRNDRLYLGYGPSKAMLIADHWAWKGCAPARDGAAVVVTCPEGPAQALGRFWIVDGQQTGPAVRFSWKDPEAVEGVVGLPSGSQPALECPTSFAGGITNYW